MNPLARAIMACAQAGGAPPWTSTDLPNRIGHLIAGTGMTLSGSDVTAWADQSPVPKTVTITGSPTYDAADANMNSLPSVALNSPDKVEIAVDRSTVAFVAGVVYTASTAALYAWDGSASGASRIYCVLTTSVLCSAPPAGQSTLATGIYGGGGRRRLIVPYDGTTASRIDGTARGTMTLNASSGTGMVIASNLTPAAWSTVAEWICCSAVPSSGDLDLLQAYWEAKYS